jgi:hypothetical protein
VELPWQGMSQSEFGVTVAPPSIELPQTFMVIQVSSSFGTHWEGCIVYGVARTYSIGKNTLCLHMCIQLDRKIQYTPHW